MPHSLLAAYLPIVPAASEPAVTKIIVYVTAFTLIIGLVGHLTKMVRAAWRGIRRLERAAAALEELPEWREAVDQDRAALHSGLEWVNNLTEAIAREFGIPVRGRPQ